MVLATSYVALDRSGPTFTAANCPFCQPSVLDSQTFYEEDGVMALCTYKPVVPGHCLVIPKRHVERFEQLSEEEIAKIGRVIKLVNQAAEKAYGTAAYLLLQKNGREVGQTVPHVHVHYMPRKAGDDSVIAFLWKMLIATVRKPISLDERKRAVDRMKCAIEYDL